VAGTEDDGALLCVKVLLGWLLVFTGLVELSSLSSLLRLEDPEEVGIKLWVEVLLGWLLRVAGEDVASLVELSSLSSL